MLIIIVKYPAILVKVCKTVHIEPVCTPHTGQYLTVFLAMEPLYRDRTFAHTNKWPKIMQ